jgi:lipopolysaccharide export system permease protein
VLRSNASPTLFFYVARTFASRIGLVLVTILALLQVMDVIGESNRILAASGAGEADLWRYAGLRLPVLLSQFLPFTVLIAALITFGTFAATSQVVVMRALGLSPHQILSPMLAVGALCGIFDFVWSEGLSMPAAARLAVWQAAGYGAHSAERPAEAGVTWVTMPRGVMRARVHPGDGGIELANIVIFSTAAEGQLAKVTLADGGFLGDDGVGALRGARTIDLTGDDALDAPPENWSPGVRPAHFLYRAAVAEETSFEGLQDSIRSASGIGRDTRTLSAELHHKLARPFASLLMPLVGALAAFGLARTNTVLTRAAFALALGFGFFNFDNMMMSMGRAGALPPELAAWTAAVLFLLVGETLLVRAEQ